MKNIINFLKNIIKKICNYFNIRKSKNVETKPDQTITISSFSSCIPQYYASEYAKELFVCNTPSSTSLFITSDTPIFDFKAAPQYSQTAILMPVANRIEPQVEEALRELEAMGMKVFRQTGYSAIDQARNRMIYYALYQHGYESVLWIDSDVVFKADDVIRLIDHDLPVCAGAYPFKNPYTRQMAITTIDNEPIEFGTDKLVEIQCAATGFLFIKREVCDEIIKTYQMPLCNTSFDQPCYPVFKPDNWIIDGVHYYLGEDYSFCMRARECGYKVMLDPIIKLGHIGTYVYSWEDVVHGPKQEVKQFKFTTHNHKHNS